MAIIEGSRVCVADCVLLEAVANNAGCDSIAGQFAENLIGTDRTNADWFLFTIGVDANGNN